MKGFEAVEWTTAVPGTIKGKFVKALFSVLSFLMPGKFACGLTCIICGEDVADTAINEHLRYFHPEVFYEIREAD